ncbi:MAG: NAD-dependent protein deacylase [Oscillospiraceae bacterium]|nr:NAD-dependent protein deacylase [Oscillospiraceae bacterium]
MNKINKLASLMKQSKYTVFFGGAGVSTESGIPDFRSESGLYAAKEVYGYPPEELLSRGFFEREPALFFRYYKENLIARGARPNAAHRALAELEPRGLLRAVVTQNIDGLHQMAGSKNVLELHGSNHRPYCVLCRTKYPLEYILDSGNCEGGVVPVCKKCGGTVRPDVVLYGENLDGEVVSAATEEITSADLLIVGGTSLSVYPAAGLLRYFRGGALVLINKTETPYDGGARLVVRDAIGKTLDQMMEVLDGR